MIDECVIDNYIEVGKNNRGYVYETELKKIYDNNEVINNVYKILYETENLPKKTPKEFLRKNHL